MLAYSLRSSLLVRLIVAMKVQV